MEKVEERKFVALTTVAIESMSGTTPTFEYVAHPIESEKFDCDIIYDFVSTTYEKVSCQSYLDFAQLFSFFL
jgi:hypothetical protein